MTTQAMELEANLEQQQIRDTARRFLQRECPPSLVRALREQRTSLPRGIWTKMAELGWLGLPFASQYGGSAADWSTIGLVMEELGRACDPTPFVDAVLNCGWLLQEVADDPRRFLEPLITGHLQPALAILGPDGRWDAASGHATIEATASGWRLDGSKLFVKHAGSRDLLLTSAHDTSSGQPCLLAVPTLAPGVECVPLRSLAHPDLHEVRFNAVSLDRDALLCTKNLGLALDRMLLRSAVFQSAAAVGGARRVLEMATDHAKARRQFGRPIGSFQAVQHLLADAWSDVETARLAAYEGITELERSPEAIAKAAAAKCISNAAFTRTCFTAHQIFGGMGFMWETDLHLWTRKAKEIELGDGGLAYHRRLLADTLWRA